MRGNWKEMKTMRQEASVLAGFEVPQEDTPGEEVQEEEDEPLVRRPVPKESPVTAEEEIEEEERHEEPTLEADQEQEQEREQEQEQGQEQ